MSVLTRIFARPGGRSYSRGMTLFNRMEYALAAVEFDRMLAGEKRPQSLDAKLARFYSAEAHAKVGIGFYKSGDLNAARAEFERALRVQAHYPDLYAYLGILDARDGRWAIARDRLDASLALCPTQREALAARIVVLEHLADAEAAGRDWERFRALGLAAPRLLPHQPRLPITPHCLEELKASHPHASLSETLRLYDDGDWDRALAVLDRALLECPAYADLHYRRGLLMAERNRCVEALAAFETAESLKPRFLNALHARGLCLMSLSRWREAAEILGRATELEPQYADIAYAHAVAVFELGDLEDARTSLSAALAVNPRFWRARTAVAVIDLVSGDRSAALRNLESALSHHVPQASLFWAREHALECREDGAVGFWSGAVASHPDYPDLCLQLGLAHIERGNLPAARAAFERAIAINPGYAQAHAGLGKVAIQAGFPGHAVSHFTRVLDFHPEWADVWCLLAEARAATGDLARAAADFEQSLAINPGYVDGLLGLAVVRSRQRRAEEARGLYERVLRESPGHPVAEALLARSS